MGSVVGKVMEENFKKQQDFMVKNQEDMLERQIQMQNQMRERQAAMMLARARDMFMWWSVFYATLAGLGIMGFAKSKNPAALAPLFPFGFVVGYQYDLAYLNKLQRCRVEAEKIMVEESGYLQLPHNLPTIQSIDAGRGKSK